MRDGLLLCLPTILLIFTVVDLIMPTVLAKPYSAPAFTIGHVGLYISVFIICHFFYIHLEAD
jgi:hypothetical protein